MLDWAMILVCLGRLGFGCISLFLIGSLSPMFFFLIVREIGLNCLLCSLSGVFTLPLGVCTVAISYGVGWMAVGVFVVFLVLWVLLFFRGNLCGFPM